MSFQRPPVSKNPDMILPGQKPHPPMRAGYPHVPVPSLCKNLLRAIAKLVRA